MTPQLTDRERAEIVTHLKAGKSHGWIGREVGRHHTTVGRIAKDEGIESTSVATKKAVAAKRDYDLLERLALLNEGFDKAREILPTIKDPRDLQSWMIAVATGIDKRRLEDGEATNRSESIDPERRLRMKQSLDELAAHRRATGRT